MTVLVVGGEKGISEFLVHSLAGVGYRVEYEQTAEAALHNAGKQRVDILVADACLPDMSGARFVESIRERKGSPPIIVLGGTPTVEDRVRCLNAGADDYIQKPFAMVELQARMRSVLRRSTPIRPYLRVGDLLLDCVRRKANRAGRIVHLSPKEFDIMEYLVRNRGKSLSRKMIVEHVWERKPDKLASVVDVYIRCLRAKLDDGYDEKLIETVRGIGYGIRNVDDQDMRDAAQAV